MARSTALHSDMTHYTCRTAPAASEAELAELSRYEPVSPELFAARALLRRVDSKFVASRALIQPLLRELATEFHVAMSAGHPLGTYETLYFDTPQFDFFHQHRRGRRPRNKVRIRHYVERDLCYLEIKTKDRYSVTNKNRFARDAGNFELGPDDFAAIELAIGKRAALVPSAWIHFPRVTLVGVTYPERLTIDLGIAMKANGTAHSFDGVSIIEIKQPRFDGRSPAFLALRRLGIRRHRVSKYCVSLTAAAAVRPVGTFLPALRTLYRSNHA